jgi:hypothetical protein
MTAKALGLTAPAALQAAADESIEWMVGKCPLLAQSGHPTLTR